jgi:menaquinone-specific isochorismate synthase
LLRVLPGARPLAWVRQDEGLVGWGETAVIPVPAGPGQLAVAERLLGTLFDTAETEDQVGLAGCGMVAFGSFTFDAARDGSVLVVPRAVIGRRDGITWVTTITAAGQGTLADDGRRPGPAATGLDGEAGLTAAQWERAVAAAVGRIRAGGLRKVVLARDLQVTTPPPIDVAGAMRAWLPATRTATCSPVPG